ncbi:hypothetical protein BGW42_003615 [Actinomortierella wolfii]|nr:hypothetical protein BGW42_003615 [Actinomortierella wolfii]
MLAGSLFGPLQNISSTIASIVDQSKPGVLHSTPISNGSAPLNVNEAFASLPTTFYDKAIDEQLKPVLETFPSMEPAYLLEVAFRLHLLATQSSLAASSTELKISLFLTLDLLLRCQELGLCDDGVPLALVEEVLDLQAIDNCESIYEYLELRKERLTVGMEPNRGKGLTLLRLCNELLKRLSRAKNTVFCGRILVFLAGSFPPSEQSGVNKRGEYNVDNVTVIEDEVPPMSETSNSAMDIDEGKRPTVTTTHEDWEFYRQFWGLQEFFSNPATLANSPEKQATLRKSMEDALTRFIEVNDERRRRLAAKGDTTTPLTTISYDTKEDTKDEDTKDAVVPKLKRKHTAAFGSRAAAEAASSTYFPKFLTSPALLKLEISDPYFRRHILLQFLIMIDFLLDHAEDPQKDWSNTPNKAMIPTWTVDNSMVTWATDFRKRIGRELAVTSMSASGNGRGFTLTVKNTLIHERSWIQWKAENCKPFEKPRMSSSSVETMESNRKRMKLRVEPVEFRRSMGCSSLTELWETSVESDFWDEIMMTNGQMPKDVLDDYLNGIERTNRMMPMQRKNMGMSPLTPEDIQERDKSQLYRALRLGSEFHLHLYNQVVNAPNGVYTVKDFAAAIKKDQEFEKEVESNGGKLPPRQPPQPPQQQQQQQQPPQQPSSQQPQSQPLSQSATTVQTASTISDATTTTTDSPITVKKDEGEPNGVEITNASEEKGLSATTEGLTTTPIVIHSDNEDAEDKATPTPQESLAMEVDEDRTGLGIVIIDDDNKEVDQTVHTISD